MVSFSPLQGGPSIRLIIGRRYPRCYQF